MIDVIVPVYNTEKYLRRCVESVLAQTYTDFELILVDDGSPDQSGLICDEFAARDDRVKVIHQENGGLSCARNAGLEWSFAHSDSEWITFIDSDDWVSTRYLELLLNAAQKTGTQVSVCENVKVNSVQDAEKYGEAESADVVVIPAEPFYCEKGVTFVTAWGKLYAKELWKQLRFPAGKIHEDEFVTYLVLFGTEEAAYLATPLYYYYVNPEGITGSKWSPARLAALDAMEQQIQYMRQNGYQRAFRKEVMTFCEVAYDQLCEIDRTKYPKETEMLKDRLRNHIVRYRRMGVVSRKETRFYCVELYPIEMKMMIALGAVKRKIFNIFRSLKKHEE